MALTVMLVRESAAGASLISLSELYVDRVCDPVTLFRFMLFDCVGKRIPPGAWPDGQAPNKLGFIC